MITLSLPNQTNDDGTIIPGGSFGFFRGMEGEHVLEGSWQTLSHIGNTPPGVVVHIDLQKALTQIALERGLNDGYKFARNIPAPKKEKRPAKDPNAKPNRSPRKNPNLMSGFNPFDK